jgi:hypothetical protein
LARDAKIAENNLFPLPLSLQKHWRTGRTAKERLSALIYDQTVYGGILFTLASWRPKGLLIFAFRPLSGKQKK